MTSTYEFIKFAEYLYDCDYCELREFASKSTLNGRSFLKQEWTYNVLVTYEGNEYEARLEWRAPEDRDDGPHYHPGKPGWWVKENGTLMSEIPTQVSEAMLSLIARFYEDCLNGVA
nr:MAG TPA: hypothetical protein [Caudoviricetes sp.]